MESLFMPYGRANSGFSVVLRHVSAKAVKLNSYAFDPELDITINGAYNNRIDSSSRHNVNEVSVQHRVKQKTGLCGVCFRTFRWFCPCFWRTQKPKTGGSTMKLLNNDSVGAQRTDSK